MEQGTPAVASNWRKITARRIALASLGLVVACGRVEPPPAKAPVESASMKRIRQIFARVPETLAKNHKVFAVRGGEVKGFGAGDAYPQIWLRDSAWIVPAASAYYEADTLTSWLDLHLNAAEKNGRLRDWVASASPETFREWAPRVTSVGSIAVDTNSNESDQEPSAALAYCRAREAFDRDDEAVSVEAVRVAQKVRKAMDALLRDRTDPSSGLIWSGLTADWGDVSPLYPDQRAIYLDAKTPRTLSLYSNVMVYAALQCLAALEEAPKVKVLQCDRAEALGALIRKSFWMPDRGYFRIRRTLDPVPPAFDAAEDDRFALGGNALAALFGVAQDAQAARIFETAERLRVARNFSTISTTLVPPYDASVFLHPAMRDPFRYQNGGQWDWFGAPMVEAEFERGRSALARSHLDQIVARTLRAGPGLHEWYGQDGSTQGSGAYAASAATIHQAIVKGLLGVSHSSSGSRIVIRTGETLLPFEVPQRARSERLVLSQIVSPSAVAVEVSGDTRVREVCSVLPAGRKPGETRASSAGFKQSVRTVGADTMMCADVEAGRLPLQVRFAIQPF